MALPRVSASEAWYVSSFLSLPYYELPAQPLNEDLVRGLGRRRHVRGRGARQHRLVERDVHVPLELAGQAGVTHEADRAADAL
eukprot:scaffold74762_cov48-Phaeocystis_antarctica.AAC.1